MLLLIERARDGKCGAKRKIKRFSFFRSGPQLKHTTFMRRVANMQRRESREMWSLPFKKLKICVWKKKPCLSISPIKREKHHKKHVAGDFPSSRNSEVADFPFSFQDFPRCGALTQFGSAHNARNQKLKRNLQRNFSSFVKSLLRFQSTGDLIKTLCKASFYCLSSLNQWTNRSLKRSPLVEMRWRKSFCSQSFNQRFE